MNPWILITLVMAGSIFGIDYLLRRKKWTINSKSEKISLLINMFSPGPYIFLSVLGMLWGIAGNSPETALGEVLYEKGIVESAREHKPDYLRLSQAERERAEKERDFKIC